MNPDTTETVEDLMARVDEAMYENKRNRKMTLSLPEHLEEAVT